MQKYTWVALLLCVLGQLMPGQEINEDRLRLDERVFIGSKVFSLLQSNVISPKMETAPDLDSTYKSYLHKILTTDDRLQFDLATIEFAAQLHNGHTFFWDAWLDKSNNQPLGFYAAPLEGKWVVQTSFLDNLKPGDVISKIDETAIEAFFLQQRRYISASGIAAQRHNLFLLPYLFAEQFTLTLEDGRHVEINRSTLNKPPDKTEGRWVKHGMAYIRIPAFFDPSQEAKALDYVRQFRGAKVLLIDVRNNPGGISPSRLIEALMDRPYKGWAESTCERAAASSTDQKTANSNESKQGIEHPQGLAYARPNACDMTQTSRASAFVPNPNAFRGQLILLVDGGCISACEDFLEPFKDSGRAILVGETTQGSSGLPFIYDFHNGMSLRIAVKRYYFADGSEFEGVGIKPDIEVRTTIEDLTQGKDPVLAKALELAEKRR